MEWQQRNLEPYSLLRLEMQLEDLILGQKTEPLKCLWNLKCKDFFRRNTCMAVNWWCWRESELVCWPQERRCRTRSRMSLMLLGCGWFWISESWTRSSPLWPSCSSSMKSLSKLSMWHFSRVGSLLLLLSCCPNLSMFGLWNKYTHQTCLYFALDQAIPKEWCHSVVWFKWLQRLGSWQFFWWCCCNGLQTPRTRLLEAIRWFFSYFGLLSAIDKLCCNL